MSPEKAKPRSYALGYSTCGFAPGRSMPALIEKLADLGYDGIEIELDRERLHPDVHGAQAIREVALALRRTGLRAALGTGGRHVLTQTRHHPGAVSAELADRARWLRFVEGSIKLSAELGCGAIMIHSGYAPKTVPDKTAWSWLVEGMGQLAHYAEKAGQRLGLEWHPEMFLRTAGQYRLLREQISSEALGCTLDVGHAHCTEDEPLEAVIESLARYTVHVQLEDMRDRVHQHLRLGEGQINFPDVFASFDRTGFSGVVALEFNAGDLGGSGDELARDSLAYLRSNVASCRSNSLGAS